MNKTKWLLLGLAAMLILTISISSVSADSIFNLLKFKKIDGIKQVQEGILVDLPTRKDKQEVVDSIDPKTGGPTKILTAKSADKAVLKKTLVAEDTGKTIEVPYVKENNKNILIYDPVATLWTVPIPGTEDYLITFDGTIYKTDLINNKLKKFLKDEVLGYKKDEVLSHSFAYVGTPLWGTSPSVNPSGTYLLFYTDRSMINDNMNGEMWVKNITNGDEKRVLEIGTAVIGWVNDTTVVLAGTQIISLNVESGEIKVLIENGATNVAIVKDSIVYQTLRGTLTLQSIFTGEVSTVSSSILNRSGSIQAQGSWVAVHNQVRDTDAEYSLVLYNIESTEWKLITASDNSWLEAASWLDESTILIHTMSADGKMDQATYIVNIDEVEALQ